MSGHVLDRLSPYLDRELPDSERAAVTSHLETCPACALALEQLASVDAAARGLPAEPPPGYFDDFSARVRQRIERKAPRAWTRPWAWAAAAAALFALTTPLLLQDGPRIPAPVEPDAPARSQEVLTPTPPSSAAPGQANADRPRRQPGPARALTETPGGQDKAAGSAAAGPEGKEDRTGAADSETLSRRERAAATAAPQDADPPRRGARDELDERAFAQQRPQAAAPAAATAAPPAARDEARDVSVPSAKSAGGRAGAVGEPRLAAAKARADEFTALATRRPATAAEARSLRDAWRAWADAHASDPRADEARVRVVEGGVLAWRLGGDPSDLARARRDGHEYLARPDAAQAARVHALLTGLED